MAQPRLQMDPYYVSVALNGPGSAIGLRIVSQKLVQVLGDAQACRLNVSTPMNGVH